MRNNFDIEFLCHQAILVSKQVPEVILDYSKRSLDDLDCLINYYMNYKRLLSSDAMWNIAVCLGTYFGEVILKSRLRGLGFKWDFDENDLPIIIHSNKKWSISPIKIIFKKFTVYEKNGKSIREIYEEFMNLVKLNRYEKERKIIKGGDY